jgi:hypothetical protein
LSIGIVYSDFESAIPKAGKPIKTPPVAKPIVLRKSLLRMPFSIGVGVLSFGEQHPEFGSQVVWVSLIYLWFCI